MKRNDTVVGLFILFGGAALAYGALSQDGPVEDAHQRLTLDATAVHGVAEGTPVTMGGYPIGSVDWIELHTEPRVRFSVHLALAEEIPVHAGTQAILGSRLAGGAEIELRQPEKIGALLAPDARLTLESPGAIADLVPTAIQIAEDLSVMTALGRDALSGGSDELGARLRRLDAAMAEMEQVFAETRELVAHVDRVVGSAEKVVDEAGPGVVRGVATAERALGKTDAVVDELAAAVDQLDARLREMGRVVEVAESYDPRTNAEIRATLTSLQAASASLERLMVAMEAAPVRTIRRGTDEEEAP